MFSFFTRNQRGIFAVVMGGVIVSMMFYGTGSSASAALPKKAPDAVYKVGVAGKERELSKRKLEAMKTYLTYDFGYSFNDALEKQNVFSDGFFFTLMDSPFGKQLVEKFFPLLKEDFSQRIAKHRKMDLYEHPSGKLDLQKELSIYAADLHKMYVKVKDKERVVDASLFNDCVSLFGMHRHFRPRDIRLLSKVFIRDRKLGEDPAWGRRNFALFQARSNEEVFGKAFMELSAQVVLAGAIYAEESGYSTTVEEALGVIERRALDAIGTKYNNITEKRELFSLKEKYRASLGFSEEDMVEAARAVITLQKMIKDVDSSVLLDKLTMRKLYSNHTEQLLVKMVQDSGIRSIHSAMDALELQCYLEAIGETKGFLTMPEKEYESEELFAKNENLLVKTYKVKMAKVSKRQVGNAFPLKEVWAYQSEDSGWEAICEKFSFDKSLEKDSRFAYLRGLEKKVSKEVDDFTKNLLVEKSPEKIEEALFNQSLKKVSLTYNRALADSEEEKDFRIKELSIALDALEEGGFLNCYTQDDNLYFRVVLIEKPLKMEFPEFLVAKRKGYLAAIVEKKLEKFNKGKKVSEEKRESLVHVLLKQEAKEQAEEIIRAEKEGKPYIAHKEARMKEWKAGAFKDSEGEFLSQFNMYEQQEIVDRVGENREMALDEFYSMEAGAVSGINYLKSGDPYYIHFITKKVDEDKLKQVNSAVHRNLSEEMRGALYTDLLTFIVDNKMLEMSRIKKEVE